MGWNQQLDKPLGTNQYFMSCQGNVAVAHVAFGCKISRLIWIYERDGAVDLAMWGVVHMSWLAAIFNHQKFQVPKMEESWAL